MKRYSNFLLFMAIPLTIQVSASEHPFHFSSLSHKKPFAWLAERKASDLRYRGEKIIEKIQSADVSSPTNEANFKILEETLKKVEKVDSATLGSKESLKKEKFLSAAKNILHKHSALKKEATIFNIAHFSVPKDNQNPTPSIGQPLESSSHAIEGISPVPQEIILKHPFLERELAIYNIPHFSAFEGNQDLDASVNQTSSDCSNNALEKISVENPVKDKKIIDEISLEQFVLEKSVPEESVPEESIANRLFNSTIVVPVNLPRPPSFSAINQMDLTPYSSALPIAMPNILKTVSDFCLNHVKHRLLRVTIVSSLVYLKNLYQSYKKNPKIEKKLLLKSAAENTVHSQLLKIGAVLSFVIPKMPFE